MVEHICVAPPYAAAGLGWMLAVRKRWSTNAYASRPELVRLSGALWTNGALKVKVGVVQPLGVNLWKKLWSQPQLRISVRPSLRSTRGQNQWYSGDDIRLLIVSQLSVLSLCVTLLHIRVAFARALHAHKCIFVNGVCWMEMEHRA